jgi:hypothetical protein
VRIKGAKASIKERLWEDTQKKPVEYLYATYGMGAGEAISSEPYRIPEGWLDSPTVMASIHQALEVQAGPANRAHLVPLALCLPAEHLRYLQEEKARDALSFPPPPTYCYAAICTGEDLYEEDCHLLYIESASGRVVKEHVFRFPDLFYFGTEADW